MNRKILFATVVAAAVSMSASIVAAKDLVIGLGAVLTGVDPHWHNNGQNNSNAMHVFETLVKTDVKGNLVPSLATSWKALSPTEYELKLRRGVKFHDGTPFTAKDVVFSFDRVIKGVPNSPGSFAGFMKGVTKIEAVDDWTMRFTTKKPIPLIFKNISRIYIISEKNGKGAKTEDYTTGKATIGTGPYKFVRWVPGASVEYVRNDTYWGGKEPWDKVTFKIMKNDSTRLAALLAGDVDIISAVPTTDIKRLKTDKRLKLWTSPTTRFTMFVPGFVQEPDKTKHFSGKDGKPLKENPFRKLKVRQALNLAIDRDVIVERVNQGQAVRARQYLPEGMFGHIPNYDMSTFDPKKAKQLMTEAGYPDGFRVTIHTSNDRIVNAVKTIQVVAQMWTRHLNMEMKVETMPHSVFSKRRGKLELPLYMSSWGNSLMDPMGILNPNVMTYNKKKRTGRANRGRYSNAEVDRYGELSTVEVNAERREDLSMKGLKIAMDEVAMMPLVFWVFSWGTKPDLVYTPRLDQYTLAMSVREKK
ncbi:MAG: ABC transporter substrate-binding protein [Alphaproteobacteria bacterium]|nr:ABC transporter substrate-binding protein [Alphaproteobacteria bacterium]